MLVQCSRECTPPYLSTGISNLLQPAQAEVVLGQRSTYLAFWGTTLHGVKQQQMLNKQEKQQYNTTRTSNRNISRRSILRNTTRTTTEATATQAGAATLLYNTPWATTGVSVPQAGAAKLQHYMGQQ
jgi:hypothetical protein